MSMLIKNMVMPKNCLECYFNYDMYRCMITSKSTTLADTERLSDCPLIELPPHERLIDADAWIAKVREELLSPHSKKGALEIMGAMFRYVLDAPTIIEAEKSDMDSFICIFEEDDEDGMDSFIQILKD